MFVARVLLSSPKLPEVNAFVHELLKYAPELNVEEVRENEAGSALLFMLPDLGRAILLLKDSPIEEGLADMGAQSSLARYYSEDGKDINTEHSAHLYVILDLEESTLNQASIGERCSSLTLLAKFCLAAIDTTPAVAVHVPASHVTHPLGFFRENITSHVANSFPYMLFVGLTIAKVGEGVLAAELPRRPNLAVHSTGLEILGLRELVIRTSEELLDNSIPLFHDAIVGCIGTEQTPKHGDTYRGSGNTDFQVTHEDSPLAAGLPVWSIVLR